MVDRSRLASSSSSSSLDDGYVVPSDDVQPEHRLLHAAVGGVHPLEAILENQVRGLIETPQDADDVPPVVGDDGDLRVHERGEFLRHGLAERARTEIQTPTHAVRQPPRFERSVGSSRSRHA